MKINHEHPAQRCEICHQADMWDGIECKRCGSLAVQTPGIFDDKWNQPQIDKMTYADMAAVSVLVIIFYAICIFIFKSGL